MGAAFRWDVSCNGIPFVKNTYTLGCEVCIVATSQPLLTFFWCALKNDWTPILTSSPQYHGLRMCATSFFSFRFHPKAGQVSSLITVLFCTMIEKKHRGLGWDHGWHAWFDDVGASTSFRAYPEWLWPDQLSLTWSLDFTLSSGPWSGRCSIFSPKCRNSSRFFRIQNLSLDTVCKESVSGATQLLGF